MYPTHETNINTYPELQPLNGQKKASFLKVFKYYLFEEKIGETDVWHDKNRCYNCCYTTLGSFLFVLMLLIIACILVISPINYVFGLIGQLLLNYKPINFNYLYNITSFFNFVILAFLVEIMLCLWLIGMAISKIIKRLKSCYQEYNQYATNIV